MILTVIRHSIRNRGGDRLILDYLAHLVKQGHEVIYWTNEVNTDFPIDTRIHIKKIPLPGVLGTILFALIQKFRVDVLIVDLVVMALFTSLRNRDRILYVAQDFDLTYHKSALLNAFIHGAYKIILNKLGVPTVSVSEGLTEKLSRYQPQRLTTVTNGVDLAVFYRDSNSSYLNKRTKPFVALFFAREDRRKGFDIARQAIERLKRLRPKQDWEIWTIGTIPLIVEEIPVTNFGFLKTDGTLRDLLSAVDIFMIPSRSEGLSLLLLQALACRCVVVTTSASSIIHHETDGLVSPVEDSLALAQNLNRVMEDAPLRERLKANARLLAQQYSLDKSCQQFESIIRSYERHSG